MSALALEALAWVVSIAVLARILVGAFGPQRRAPLSVVATLPRRRPEPAAGLHRAA